MTTYMVVLMNASVFVFIVYIGLEIDAVDCPDVFVADRPNATTRFLGNR